jgi:hypothetical protein
MEGDLDGIKNVELTLVFLSPPQLLVFLSPLGFFFLFFLLSLLASSFFLPLLASFSSFPYYDHLIFVIIVDPSSSHVHLYKMTHVRKNS